MDEGNDRVLWRSAGKWRRALSFCGDPARRGPFVILPAEPRHAVSATVSRDLPKAEFCIELIDAGFCEPLRGEKRETRSAVTKSCNRATNYCPGPERERAEMTIGHCLRGLHYTQHRAESWLSAITTSAPRRVFMTTVPSTHHFLWRRMTPGKQNPEWLLLNGHGVWVPHRQGFEVASTTEHRRFRERSNPNLLRPWH